MTHPIIMTVDLDRDWPIECHGRAESISGAIPDTPDDPTVTATLEGTRWLLEVFRDHSVTATFYAEAAVLKKISKADRGVIRQLRGHEIGCHGYAHEDLTGEGTGYAPGVEFVREQLTRAVDSITEVMSRPTGFRAPYLRANHEVELVVRDLGFTHDSSHTVRQATSLGPVSSGGLIKLPLSTGRDPQGKVISGYLWQLLEGNRSTSDYLFFVKRQGEVPAVQYSMLAIHPWHLFFRTSTGRYLSGSDLEKNLDQTEKLIGQLSSQLVSAEQFLKERGMI